MNGPEHFRRGEALLRSCQLVGSPDTDDDGREVEIYSSEPDENNALLAAQAHFLAAQVAATIYAIPDATGGEWAAVLS